MRENHQSSDPYAELAAAICGQAAEDYRNARAETREEWTRTATRNATSAREWRPTMSAEPKPLAAIIAEMRDGIHTGRADIIDAVNERLRSCADRIKAAVARERKEYERLHESFWKEGTIQNFVRQLLDHSDDIRDAKPELAEAIRHFAQELIKAATPSTGNAAAMRDALERALKWWTEKGNILEREAAFKQIRAALAAPARNCDRFKTAVEAMEEWGKYPQSRYKGCRVCPHGDASMVSPSHLTLAEWLFSPVKGGAE